jgi:hypothetical protein
VAPKIGLEPSDPDRDLYRSIVGYVLTKTGEKDHLDRELVDLVNLVLGDGSAEEKLRRWIEHEV